MDRWLMLNPLMDRWLVLNPLAARTSHGLAGSLT